MLMHVKTTLSSAIAALRRRYLTALLTDPAVTKIPASTSGATLSLKQVYLPRTILHEVKREQSGDAASESTSSREVVVKEPVNLWEKLRDHRVVLIEGPAGMGKSTLSKHLVRESLARARRLPIWIPFHRFAASQLPFDEYLDQIYVSELGLGTARVTADDDATKSLSLGQWLYGQWRGGLGLLILDGLDEVFDLHMRTAALQRLHLEGTGGDRPVTILTTRPLTHGIPIKVEKTELQALRPIEQIQLLSRYRPTMQLTEAQFQTFLQKVETHSAGRELMSRPGHLVQMLGFYAERQALPSTETELLTYLLHRRLQTTGRIQPPVDPDDPATKKRLLASIALHLLACRKGRLHTRAQLLALIQQVLTEHAGHHRPLFSLSQASPLLNDLLHNSGLLTRVGMDPERYAIESAIWASLLTGTALADRQTRTSLDLTEGQVLEFLDKKAWDPEWEPVLKAWVGQTDNPFPLFERLTDKTQDDLARHRLGTAGRCLIEVKSSLTGQQEYQAFSVQIPTEAFEVWKAEALRGTQGLVENSLRAAWAETKYGQTEVLKLLTAATEHMRIVIKALGGLGPAMSEPVQQAMVAQFQDRDESVLRAASEALCSVGVFMSEPVQQALVARLQDPDELVRWMASKALRSADASMSESVQQTLVTWLQDPIESVREAASEALRGMGASMPKFVQQALIKLLKDPEQRVRGAAGEALRSVGVSMSESVQQALVGLWQGDGWMCSLAGLVLRSVGASMSESVQQALVRLLRDSDKSKSCAASQTLCSVGASMSESVQQALVALLRDSDDHVCWRASLVLSSVGASMPESVRQALVVRLHDPDDVVRWQASKALAGWGTSMPEAVQQALVEQLHDSDNLVCHAASQTLSSVGASMSESVQQALLVRLQDSDEAVREGASEALAGLGTSMSVPVQQTLVKLLKNPKWGVRREASEALRGMGASMPKFVQQALVKLLEDPARLVRRAAHRALYSVGAFMSEPVQLALVEWLKDPDDTVGWEVSEALCSVGASMSESVQQALVERLQDPDEAVREVASKALASAQQQGVRLIPNYVVLGPRRPGLKLSATAPFRDGCAEVMSVRRQIVPLSFDT
ncbi:MAG TPA: HEAT repeat domain-containing protein [Nitrospira sp.]|nr:HEAT repeat domain-containing protein [Nitrospira sp.]